MGLQSRAYLLISNPWFDRFIIAAVFCNCIFLANENPKHPEGSKSSYLAEQFFAGVFVLEMFLKIFGMSISGYFEDAWNWFDFCVVMQTLISASMVVYHFFTHRSVATSNFSALRVLRMLRPLKAIKFIPQVKVLFVTFFRSIYTSTQITMLFFMVILIFGNFAQVYFDGSLLGRCSTVVENRFTQSSAPVIFDYQVCGGFYHCKADPCGSYVRYANSSHIFLNDSQLVFDCHKELLHCQNPAVSPSSKYSDTIVNLEDLYSAMTTVFEMITFEAWQDVFFFFEDGIGNGIGGGFFAWQ